VWCVLSEVRTEFLNNIQTSFFFKGLILDWLWQNPYWFHYAEKSHGHIRLMLFATTTPESDTYLRICSFSFKYKSILLFNPDEVL
jgi:hypothetical protein